MTRTPNLRMAQWLTYAGTLPLVIAAVEMVAGRIPAGDIVWFAFIFGAITASSSIGR